MTTSRTEALSHEAEYSKLKNSSSSSSEDLNQVIIPTPVAGARRVKRLKRRKDYDCLKQKPQPKSSCCSASTAALVCVIFLLFTLLVCLGAFHYRLSQEVSRLQVQSLLASGHAASLTELRQKVSTAETLCHEVSLNVTNLSTLLSSLHSKWVDVQSGAARSGDVASPAFVADGPKGVRASTYAEPQEEHTTAFSSTLALLSRRLADLEQTVYEYGRRINGTPASLAPPVD